MECQTLNQSCRVTGGRTLGRLCRRWLGIALVVLLSFFYHSFTQLCLKITRVDHSAGMQGQNAYQITMAAVYEWKHLNNGYMLFARIRRNKEQAVLLCKYRVTPRVSQEMNGSSVKLQAVFV